MVEKSHFLEQQTVLLFKSIYFVLYVHMRRMKGREEGCKQRVAQGAWASQVI